MDGVYFYWFCWIIWVIVTFLFPKTKIRTIIAVWILLTISLSRLYISISYVEISAAYLCIFIGIMICLTRVKPVSIHLFSAFTIMIGYSSILIWESIAPVWLFMPRLLIIPMISVLLMVILSKGFYGRFTTGILGLCGGELLYGCLLVNFSIPDIIGELQFLDILLVVLLFLLCIEGYQLFRNKLFLYFSKANP
jgi:hypothetical protein